jgi:hypothetical protein
MALLLGEVEDAGGEEVDELADVRLLPGQGLVGRDLVGTVGRPAKDVRCE